MIVGGGKQAFSKMEKLLAFDARLTVIAPKIDEQIIELAQKAEEKICLRFQTWEEAVLENAVFVIAATEDRAENARIAQFCRERRILVNAVDQPADCGFYFPAIIRDGALTVAVASDGKSPAGTAWVKKRVEAAIPEGTGNAIELLGQLRSELIALRKDFTARARLQELLLEYCLEHPDVSLEELRALLMQMTEE